jgi:hypothetical protein
MTPQLLLGDCCALHTDVTCFPQSAVLYSHTAGSPQGQVGADALPDGSAGGHRHHLHSGGRRQPGGIRCISGTQPPPVGQLGLLHHVWRPAAAAVHGEAGLQLARARQQPVVEDLFCCVNSTYRDALHSCKDRWC